MKFGVALLVAATLVWSALVGVTAAPPALQAPKALQAPQAPSSEYVGSAACQRCHEAEHGQWQRSLHVKMTKPVADATIVGNFGTGTRLAAHGRSFEFGRKDGKPFMKVAFGDRAPETFTVDYTLGAKRYQGYLSMLPDGRMYVLPAFWHIETGRWIDWKEITPIPDGAHDLKQIWNANCFNCHATNLAQGYDTSSKTYQTTWTEMGIGCEACHGPGRAHVALADAWDRDPSTKPAYDNSSENRQLTDVLKTLSTRSAAPRRTFDTCAYCHGNKTNVFVGFRAGDRYEDYALPFLLSDEIPANDLQGEFWPDGKPNRFNRNQALMLSGCFQAGAIVCTNCHVAHGSRYEHSLKVNIYQGRYGDTLCTQCHQSSKTPAGAAVAAAPSSDARSFLSAEGLRAHTFHAPESEGSRCVACHMSDLNWRMLVRRRDHTMRPPNPEMTARYGVPNACTTCHDDRSPEWAAKQMDAWWGDAGRRQRAVATADVMYRAGSGDVTVLPGLGRLAVDRSQSVLIRASAADYAAKMLISGQSVEGGARVQSQTSLGGVTAATQNRRAVPADAVTPALVNMLIAAAADPEPVVRAAAVRALAATGQDVRVIPPLTARLIDPARVVRARAAGALLTVGVAVLPGAAGVALAQAQDEWALSLRQFPDVASNHASRAWLESERGRPDDALQAADEAIRLDPNVARPYVLKGVLAARAGRYGEAIELWKKARSVEPGYPRIDQLIAEGEKRRGEK